MSSFLTLTRLVKFCRRGWLFLALSLSSVQALTYTVTSTNDAGVGSLRAAIDQVNSHAGGDTIAFNIAGAGPHVITLLSQLPDVTDNATLIDGATQPGYLSTPQIVISGLSLGQDLISGYRASGLIVRGDFCTVAGLDLLGFHLQAGQFAEFSPWDDANCAVRLHGARGLVRNCYFGIAPTGDSMAFNGAKARNKIDVQVRGQFNLVRNNVGQAIVIMSAGAMNNTVRQNTLGFQANGEKFPAAEEADPLFQKYGVVSVRGGTANFIGVPGMGNLVRNEIEVNGGGSWHGEFHAPGSVVHDALVVGNSVGITAGGTVVGGSIYVTGETYDTHIGGSAPGEGNVVHTFFIPRSAYSYGSFGIVVGESAFGHLYSRRVRIEGNEVRGANLGIFSNNWDSDPLAVVSIFNNTLRNCEQGIVVGRHDWGGHDPSFAHCQGNVFPGTLRYPINLGFIDSGLEPNDPLDADTGSNGLQNFPVLESVTYDAGSNQTVVTGRLDSMPSKSYRIELYSSVQVLGHEPVGEVTHGTALVFSNAAGTANFQFSLAGFHSGRVFSALVSNMTDGGWTSAMSAGLTPASGTLTLLPAVVSVSESGISATLRILRTGGTYGAVSARLAVNGSTAASDDLRFLYTGITAAPPVVFFANGDTEQTVTLFAYNDTLNEALETFTLSLTAPTGGASAAALTSLVLVADNDPLPSFSVNDIEVNEDVGTANFTVTLSAPSGQATRVTVSTLEGTAYEYADYAPATSTMIFAPGETSKPAAISIVNSATQEPQEYLFLSLYSPVNATVATPFGSCRINDLNGAVVSATNFSWFTTSFTTGEAGFGGQAFATIQRTGSTVGPASVRVSTLMNNASAADVTPWDHQLVSFADGEKFQTITLELHDDALDENDEQFYLILSDPVAVSVSSVSAFGISVTLQDDDAMPTLTAGSVNVTEGDAGETVVDIPFALSAPTGRFFRASLNVTGGSANAADYLIFGEAFVLEGETVGHLSIHVIGDYVGEPDDNVNYDIVSEFGHPNIGGKLKIINDDPLVPTFRLEGVPATVQEDVGEFSVTLRRLGVISGTDSCQVITIPTTSSAQVRSSNYTFAPGEEIAVVKITVTDDYTDEPDELADLLVQPTAPAVAAAPGTWPFTILDNDSPPVVSLDGSINVVEQDNTSTTVSINVSLSNPSAFAVKIQNLATGAGTASGTADYVPLSIASYTFPPGAVNASFLLTILGDYLDEADETIPVTLASVINGTLGLATQTITILDNDTAQRPYRNWLAGHFNAAERRTAQTDPCADPDGDGLNNSMEYFLESNPRSASSGPERFSITHEPTYMLWSFTGRTSRVPFAGIRITASKNLLEWGDIQGRYLNLNESPPDSRQYKIAVPFADTDRLFLRAETDCPAFTPEP